MSGERLTREQVQALLDAATPAPWDLRYVQEAVRHIARNCDFIDGDDPGFGWDRYRDAALVAAAPQLARMVLDLHHVLDWIVTLDEDLGHHGELGDLEAHDEAITVARELLGDAS